MLNDLKLLYKQFLTLYHMKIKIYALRDSSYNNSSQSKK